MTANQTFSNRYLLAGYRTDGVIVDLQTGNYFLLDELALRVCEAMTANGDAAAVAASVAAGTAIGIDRARQAVDSVRLALDTAPVRGTPTGPYHFHPDGKDRYALWHDGVRVLEVHGSDWDIAVRAGTPIRDHPLLEFYVRALAPKIMFLRGIAAIHASACAVGDRVLAFAGASGAGKTTTVRAFVRAGAQPLSEDLLILGPTTDRPSIVVGSEARVHAWANRTTLALRAGAEIVSSRELATMASGQANAVDVLHFLDAGRRQGNDLVARPLRGASALVALMANHFLGDSSRLGWRRHFEVARWLTDTIQLLEVTTPAGTVHLDGGVRRYTSNWTS
jgi:hypothetical protein